MANFPQVPEKLPEFLCLPCIQETDSVIKTGSDSKFVECADCKRLDHCLPTEGKLLGSEANKVLERLENDFGKFFG